MTGRPDPSDGDDRPSVPALDEGALFAGLFEFAPDAILIVDGEGKILRANVHAERIFGWPRLDLIGQSIEMLVPENQRHHHERLRGDYVRAPRARAMGAGTELHGRRKDGSEFPVEVALGPLVTDGGTFTLAIARDATERRRTEHALRESEQRLQTRVRERTVELEEANRRLTEEQAKLVQAEKLSAIGLLAAGVAHEINNPLSGLMGCIKALRDGALSPDRRDEYYETVRDGLERMRGTVQGLLDFARQRPPSRAPVHADEVVEMALRLVRPAVEEKALRMQLRVAQDARLEGDRGQISQALVNLLLNAIYASPRRGEVEVSAERAGDRIALRVSDRGPGIPSHLMGRVTDPFFTTKPEGEGTGLGLSVTLGIVRAHGGNLALESAVGRGTTATLWLPAADAP